MQCAPMGLCVAVLCTRIHWHTVQSLSKFWWATTCDPFDINTERWWSNQNLLMVDVCVLWCICRHDTRSSTCNNMHSQRTCVYTMLCARSGHLIRPSWSRYQFYFLAVPLATFALDFFFFSFALFVVYCVTLFSTQMYSISLHSNVDNCAAIMGF